MSIGHNILFWATSHNTISLILKKTHIATRHTLPVVWYLVQVQDMSSIIEIVTWYN
jgi:hypothetical protein